MAVITSNCNWELWHPTDLYRTTGTTTAATDSPVWTTWVTSTTNTATTYNNCWPQWVELRQREMARAMREYRNGWEVQTFVPADERIAKRQTDIRVAKKRAEDLLLSVLNDQQRAELAEHQHFHVIGSDGKRYRVDTRKRHQNIYLLDGNNKPIEELCIVQSGGTPNADNHAAQKLMLETDVERLRRIANIMNVRRA